MSLKVTTSGKRVARASAQLLGNNIECYENTIPSMLANRLRNPKFTGPENHQTGIAPEWEPISNNMTRITTRLVPGAYMSGREAQLVHNFSEHYHEGIQQQGVTVRHGEVYEVEIWARSHSRPTEAAVSLHLPGRAAPEASKGKLVLDRANWHRATCRIESPGDGQAYFQITIPGDSRITIDQLHMRPVGEPHVSQALLAAFDKFPCPVLRFPGGCTTNTYHWANGTGPVHLRPVCDDPMFKYKINYDFGTDEYLELCASRKIRPLITLNTTTGTPEDAAAWAAYIRKWYSDRKLAIPAAYFVIGNENYGTWEMGHMSGEMYVTQLRDFVPPVRAAYPEARIMAICNEDSGGVRAAHRTPWRQAIMDKAADLFDLLVATSYANDHDADDMPAAMLKVAKSVAAKAAYIERLSASIRDNRLKCKIGIVEWNYWTRASHSDHLGFYEPNDIRHCLYAAGYLNVFCRNGETVEAANYYSLVNTMGMIHIKDGVVDLSDIVKVMNLYAPALPGEVLEATHNAGALAEGLASIDVNIIRSKKATFVFLTNFSQKPQRVTLEGLGKIDAAVGISGTAMLTRVKDTRPQHTEQSVTLPPMSLTRLTCN